MSYLDYTRQTLLAPTEVTVCLTAEDCKILHPFVEKAYKQASVKYEKYRDMHESGDATERQTDLMVKYYDQTDVLEKILKQMDDLIK